MFNRKILGRQVFERHRKTVMNLSADAGLVAARRACWSGGQGDDQSLCDETRGVGGVARQGTGVVLSGAVTPERASGSVYARPT